MRRLIWAIASASLLSCGLANAADMPVKARPLPPPAPVFSWTGLYIGFHAGLGWGESNNTVLENDNNLFPQGHVNHNEFNGFLGGVQVGYNYQFGLWVVGVEGQFSWANIDGDSRQEAVLLANRHVETHNEVNWVTTATGRLGYSAGPLLIYVKGGAAWADFETTRSRTIRTSTFEVLSDINGGETRSGWTVGVGAEWAFAGNWSFKAEYNFLDFGTERVTRSGANFVTGDPVTRFRDAETELHIVKVGINYRFGWGKAPVAVRAAY